MKALRNHVGVLLAVCPAERLLSPQGWINGSFSTETLCQEWIIHVGYGETVTVRSVKRVEAAFLNDISHR